MLQVHLPKHDSLRQVPAGVLLPAAPGHCDPASCLLPLAGLVAELHHDLLLRGLCDILAAVRARHHEHPPQVLLV